MESIILRDHRIICHYVCVGKHHSRCLVDQVDKQMSAARGGACLEAAALAIPLLAIRLLLPMF